MITRAAPAVAAIAVLCAAVAVLPCRADDPDPRTEGDGEVTGRQIQVYRMTPAWMVRSIEDHPWGLRVVFPVSASVLDLEGVGLDLEEVFASLEPMPEIWGATLPRTYLGFRWGAGLQAIRLSFSFPF